MINRDDMLELTRRMTVKRTHFTRIAGCYVDKDGDFEGSFNRAFGNLTASEKTEHLALAKAVPFAGTNEELREYRFPADSPRSREMWKLLMEIRSCGLKNDALLDTFYDLVMEQVQIPGPYSILLFHGVYDIPSKGKDKERLGDSESVFEYIICTLCPVTGDYHSESPVGGFLFPAYAEQCAVLSHIDFYETAGSTGRTAAEGIRTLLQLDN